VRHPRTAATVVALALALALAGCGGSGPSNGGNTFGNALTIYTALPTDGPQGRLMQSFEYGETLAVTEAHNVVDGRLISPGVRQRCVRDCGRLGYDGRLQRRGPTATQNLDAVAYIGDFDSAATATSLPITSAADILQVSPASPYIGLTDPSVYDVKGEPASYYPSGVQTFARLVPSDAQEASATTSFMHSLGVSEPIYARGQRPGQHAVRQRDRDDGRSRRRARRDPRSPAPRRRIPRPTPRSPSTPPSSRRSRPRTLTPFSLRAPRTRASRPFGRSFTRSCRASSCSRRARWRRARSESR